MPCEQQCSLYIYIYTHFLHCVASKEFEQKTNPKAETEVWRLITAHSITCSWIKVTHPLVFVVLKHANTVFDDEEEVDAGQGCKPLPHSIKSCYHIFFLVGTMFAVIVLPLRLKTGRGATVD